jgi:hypothetical protein
MKEIIYWATKTSTETYTIYNSAMKNPKINQKLQITYKSHKKPTNSNLSY